MSQFFSDSIFWIEVEKVKPNPYQPRHEFDKDRLRDLAESIRMYGILQPLVVTRTEVVKEEEGFQQNTNSSQENDDYAHQSSRGFHRFQLLFVQAMKTLE